MTQYAYSPSTGEFIDTDTPADWMGLTDVAPPTFDRPSSGCFWRGASWEIVQATQDAWSSKPIIDSIRPARDMTVLKLSSIAGTSTRRGDPPALAQACDAAIDALLVLPEAPEVLAATDNQSCISALKAVYAQIIDTAAVASPDLIKAFAKFNI